MVPSFGADGGDPLAATASTGPVLLCGYYGEHNLGDDALLEALLSLMPAGLPALVTAHDQAQVQQRFGVATVPRRSLKAVLAALGGCRALVFGGGSLLQDATSFRSLVYYGLLISAARLQGKPVLLWAQGLGPLRRRRSRLLVRALLPLVSGITWRDPDSAALASQLGVRAPHGADAVWALEPEPWRGGLNGEGGGGPIVVCWRPTPLLQGEAWRPYLQALELLAVAHDREVCWLPFHGEQDQALLDQLRAAGLVGAALLQRSRVVQAADPRQAMALFSSAGLVVAMRLHALILAGLSGAPLAALSYDPKVRSCAAGLGCPCHDLETPAFSQSLAASWEAALDQPPAAAVIAAQRQATAVHRQLLDTLSA